MSEHAACLMNFVGKNRRESTRKTKWKGYWVMVYRCPSCNRRNTPLANTSALRRGKQAWCNGASISWKVQP